MSHHGEVPEVAMTELSQFWSSLARRKSERSLAALPSLRATQQKRNHHAATPSSAQTWNALIAADTQNQVVTDNSYSGKRSERDVDEVSQLFQEQNVFDEELLHGNDNIDQQEPLLDFECRTGVSACCVDGGLIGDVPAQYVVQGLHSHEIPVIGLYVDPRITPGFSYRVRPLHNTKMLFKGQALPLLSIGMGYGKRITFASESHISNDNFFWSDSNPEGYGFTLQLVKINDKFTVKDANNESVGIATVHKLMGPQMEVGHRVTETGHVQKRARVSLNCNIEFFHDGTNSHKPVVISGLAVAQKKKTPRAVAEVTEIVCCSIDRARGYTLVAGADSSTHITIIKGEKINDIPTTYSLKGLQPYEIPVVGTYVDPRIITGFKYSVRPADSKKCLFGGDALVLQSVGRGYGKRMTFESKSLNQNENYFWSDTNPEGYGFTIQAVSPGETFTIIHQGIEEIGRAQVFRADLPQIEESTTTANGSVEKRVRVTLTCDVSFHGHQDRTLVVTGTAVVVRKGRIARVQKIEEVGVSSQMNLLFSNTQNTLTFVKE
ncbi:unnamed protein product [Meganyctiphanes norvegica]|uniref:Uncharacterized protein n=1 Tax=Meganyctiphanes norvegica TaxID=48144 RepID=A0AAV2QN87_MEGNR